MGVVRILLAMAVVVAHSAPIFGLRLTSGRVAVQLFYMISGFYMALVLTRKYTGARSYRTFITNRFLRLYPTYAVIAMVTIGAAAIFYMIQGSVIAPLTKWADGPDLGGTTKAVCLLPNLLLFGQDWMRFLTIGSDNGAVAMLGQGTAEAISGQYYLVVPQAWTLGVELMFYLIAPLIVRRKATVVAAVLLATLALRGYMVNVLELYNPPWCDGFFPIELPLFLFGVMSYKAYEVMEQRKLLNRRTGAVVLAATAGAIIGYQFVPQDVALLWRSYYYLRLPYLYFAFPLAMPWIFALTRNVKFDRMIGDLSYPVYLCHIIVVSVLVELKSDWVTKHLGLVACIASLMVAAALWRLVDHPMERWRQARVRNIPAASVSKHDRQPTIAIREAA